MNFQGISNSMKTTRVHETQHAESALQRLPQYIACAGLGVLSGVTGVALTTGLAILIQLLLPPTTLFLSGAASLMVIAILIGLLVSWTLGRVVHHIPSGFFQLEDERRVQVMLVFSAFASLLQSLLFFAGAF